MLSNSSAKKIHKQNQQVTKRLKMSIRQFDILSLVLTPPRLFCRNVVTPFRRNDESGDGGKNNDIS